MKDSINVGQRPDGSMDTYSGNHVNVLHPEPGAIVIEDIAHHLSLICRYGGACIRHYSVAQHSVHVSEQISKLEGTVQDQLAGLLHDAPEAYLGDWIRPIKYMMLESEKLNKANEILQKTIFHKFGVEDANWELVKQADNIMAATEAKQIMKSRGLGWENLPPPAKFRIPVFSPNSAEDLFLYIYSNLTKET